MAQWLTKYGTMGKALIAQRDEKEYAAFLREQSLSGDHSFLLSAISHSNLRTSVREVLEELITGNLRRPNHRPTTDYTAMKGAFRALRVLDLEAAGWDKRDAAIEEAKKQLHCSSSTIEKALGKYEDLIRGTDPSHLTDERIVELHRHR
jgi:hypothetical protein